MRGRQYVLIANRNDYAFHISVLKYIGNRDIININLMKAISTSLVRAGTQCAQIR